MERVLGANFVVLVPLCLPVFLLATERCDWLCGLPWRERFMQCFRLWNCTYNLDARTMEKGAWWYLQGRLDQDYIIPTWEQDGFSPLSLAGIHSCSFLTGGQKPHLSPHRRSAGIHPFVLDSQTSPSCSSLVGEHYFSWTLECKGPLCRNKTKGRPVLPGRWWEQSGGECSDVTAEWIA